ncbi:MAG: hypothetical protein L3J93_00725 [Thermoplasmata archaeon]|nr:hypothetical protein [Thermoplasmata archaeon]
MDEFVGSTVATGLKASSDRGSLPEVPSPFARRVLLFEFVALAEYWLAPPLLGVTNFAGIWSDLGIVLFAVFVSSIVLLVIRPLWPHLRQAERTRQDRWTFHGVWIGTFAAALFLTNTFQLSPPSSASAPVVVGVTTVYSPFGAWPSLTFYLPGAGLFGTFNVEIVTVLGLIAVLGSAVLRVSAFRRSLACPSERPFAGSAPLASAAVWSPFGLVTGCAACAPLYLSVLGLVAPAAASGGLAASPLVPWIGLAGLLYLASFGLVIHLIRRSTEPVPPHVTENRNP